MARNFDAATQLIKVTGTGAVTPLTFSAWYKPNAPTSSYQSMIALDQDPHYYQLRLNSGTGFACAECYDGVNVDRAVTAGAPSAGQWSHFCGVFANNATRAIYMNGSGSSVPGLTVSPNPNKIQVGYMRSGIHFADGEMAELAIWAATLTVDEIIALSKGIAPSLIRPSSILAYWPLIGNYNPEHDIWRNKNDLTLLAGSFAKTPHIRVFNPWQSTTQEALSAAATGTRISQIATELISLPTANFRVSQLAVELITSLPPTSLRVSQIATELITLVPPTESRISQLAIELISLTTSSRISQLAIETISLVPVVSAERVEMYIIAG